MPEYISLKSHPWVYLKFQKKTQVSCNEELVLVVTGGLRDACQGAQYPYTSYS